MAMTLTFVAGLAGTFMPALAGWFSWPAKYLLTYILDIAELVARIPGMKFSAKISTTTMVALYLFIVSLTFTWWRKAKSHGKITDTNIVK